MSIKKVDNKVDFISEEHRVLDFWKKNSKEEYNTEDKIKMHYEKFKRTYFNENFLSSNSIFVDATSFFDEFETSTFFDICHMSDKGNEVLAQKTVEIISSSILKK